jgi:hypothetical protein
MVGAELEYQELYWMFCLHKHTLPAAAGAPAVGDAELVYGPNIKGIYDAAWYSTLYFLKLCDICQDSLDLELMAQVKTVLQSAVEARNVVLASHPLLCT